MGKVKDEKEAGNRAGEDVNLPGVPETPEKKQDKPE